MQKYYQKVTEDCSSFTKTAKNNAPQLSSFTTVTTALLYVSPLATTITPTSVTATDIMGHAVQGFIAGAGCRQGGNSIGNGAGSNKDKGLLLCRTVSSSCWRSMQLAARVSWYSLYETQHYGHSVLN